MPFLILFMLMSAGMTSAKEVCSKNKANCLELPLEWNQNTENQSLEASRYVDDDLLTLLVIETDPGYWKQAIQDSLVELRKNGGFMEYDPETLFLGKYEYRALAYEAFGENFDRAASRRIDFYVYEAGSFVRIIQFTAVGGSFIKMDYEIKQILASAVFRNPDSTGSSPSKQKSPDDGWGEYGYKPKARKLPDSNTGSDDGWGAYRYQPSGT
ncbi:MAG: hypothetical protein ACE5GM_01730, partial [bacterium]